MILVVAYLVEVESSSGRDKTQVDISANGMHSGVQYSFTIHNLCLCDDVVVVSWPSFPKMSPNHVNKIEFLYNLRRTTPLVISMDLTVAWNSQ